MLWPIRSLYRILITVFVGLACSAVTLGSYLSNQPKGDFARTATAVHDLLLATDRLQESLHNSTKPTYATINYLSSLNQIEKACTQINSLKDSPKLSDDESSRINQSVALCQDLQPLASASGAVYSAVSNLLIANTAPKRYQTLKPVANRTRQKHEAAVARAISEVSNTGFFKNDYPFSTLHELKELQTTLQSTQGLAYMPAFKTFQFRLLGEREHYWYTYADFESLTRSLHNQFDSYCQSLANAGNSIKECKS